MAAHAPSTQLQFPCSMKRQNPGPVTQDLTAPSQNLSTGLPHPTVDELQGRLSSLHISSSSTPSTSSNSQPSSLRYPSDETLSTSHSVPNFQIHQPNNSGDLISRIQHTSVGTLPQAWASSPSAPHLRGPTAGSFSNFRGQSGQQETSQGNLSSGLQANLDDSAQQSFGTLRTNEACTTIGAGNNCNPSALFDNTASMCDDMDEDFDREHMSELSFMMSNLCQVDQKATNSRSGFMPYIY